MTDKEINSIAELVTSIGGLVATAVANKIDEKNLQIERLEAEVKNLRHFLINIAEGEFASVNHIKTYVRGVAKL